MDTPRSTSAVRRLESARSAVELTASLLAATVQLVTLTAVVRSILPRVGKKSKRTT